MGHGCSRGTWMFTKFHASTIFNLLWSLHGILQVEHIRIKREGHKSSLQHDLPTQNHRHAPRLTICFGNKQALGSTLSRGHDSPSTVEQDVAPPHRPLPPSRVAEWAQYQQLLPCELNGKNVIEQISTVSRRQVSPVLNATDQRLQQAFQAHAGRWPLCRRFVGSPCQGWPGPQPELRDTALKYWN